MNAKTLYEIFEATRKHDLPDLTLGMAVVRHEQPGLINDDNDRPIREFIGHHYEDLCAAYAKGSVAFGEVVAACEQNDKEKAEKTDCGDTCEG